MKLVSGLCAVDCRYGGTFKQLAEVFEANVIA